MTKRLTAILMAGSLAGLACGVLAQAEESSVPAATPVVAEPPTAPADSNLSAAAKVDSIAAPVQSESNANPSAPAPATTENESAIKPTTSYPESKNTIELSDEQKKKLREILARQKVSAAKKKREKEMLDRSPVLDKTLNPNITERGGIPNRF
jgi:hypothetical protein